MPPIKGMHPTDSSSNQTERIINQLEQQGKNVIENIAVKSLIELKLS